MCAESNRLPNLFDEIFNDNIDIVDTNSHSKYKCKICNQSFTYLYLCKKHIMVDHNNVDLLSNFIKILKDDYENMLTDISNTYSSEFGQNYDQSYINQIENIYAIENDKYYKCGICKEVFPNGTDCIMHIKYTHYNSYFKHTCKPCRNIFLTNERLQVHNMNYHDITTSKSDNYEILTNEKITEILNDIKNTKLTEIECISCGEILKKKSFKTHLESKHKQKEISINTHKSSGILLETKTQAIGAIIKISENEYECPICVMITTKKSSCSSHITTRHYSHEKKTKKDIKLPGPKSKYEIVDYSYDPKYADKVNMVCTICPEELQKTISNTDNLIRHVKIHFKEFYKKCDECEVTVFTYDLKDHKKNNHRKDLIINDIPYKNIQIKDFCNIESNTVEKNNIKIIEKTIEDIKTENINETTEEIKKEGIVEKNNTKEPKIDWYNCDECDKVYEHKTSLIRHKKKAHGNTNINRSFKKDNENNKEKPKKDYECDECSNAYQDKKSLTRHKKAKHNSSYVKPKCNMLLKNGNVCGRILSNDKELIRHQKQFKGHCPNIAYKCEFESCDMVNIDSKIIEDHIKVCDFNPDVKKVKCDTCLLDFNEFDITKHNNTFHSNTLKYYTCPYDDCVDKKNISPFKNMEDLHTHIKNKHQNGYICNFIKAHYKCQRIYSNKDSLKTHRENFHNILKCQHGDIDNKNTKCNMEFNQQLDLDIHMREVHKQNVLMIKCLFTDCLKEFHTELEFRKHQNTVHQFRNKFYQCNTKGCKLEFLSEDKLLSHKKYTHNMNTELKYCNIPNCRYYTNCENEMNIHIEYYHDIGTNVCDICLEEHKSRIEYKTNNDLIYICKQCYQNEKNKQNSMELRMSQYLDSYEHLKSFNVSNDTALISLGGCTKYRPDKLYLGEDRVIWVECDENQHIGYDPTCEESRILEAYDNFTPKKLIVIRWNPNNYKSKDNKVVDVEEKLEMLQKLITHVIYKDLKNIPSYIYTYYMFYDENSRMFTKNSPYELIYEF